MSVRRSGRSVARGATLALAVLAILPVLTRADFVYVSTTASGVVTKHPCAPQHNTENTTAAFHKTNAEAVLVTFTESCEPENAAGDVTASNFTISNLTAVNGKIAVVPGSPCAFGTHDGEEDKDPWFYYLNDFQRRVDKVIAAGAVGVIWGEGKPGKIPEQMTGHKTNVNQLVPVCTMSKSDFDTFKVSNLSSVDTTTAPMYRTEDEQYPNPTFTYLSLEEPWAAGGPNGLEFPIPAKVATFGPETASSVEAELVAARFISACDDDNYEQCASNCWNKTATETATEIFTKNLTGKIAFFTSKEELHYGCYSMFSHWAKLAMDAGAAAVVYGTEQDVGGWSFAGPYTTPFNLTIPFFSLLKIHTDTLEHVTAESATRAGHEVTIKTPLIARGAGAGYFAPSDTDFGPAPVLMWRDFGDHFYCDAGQAHFNPAPWPGLPLPAAAAADAGELNTNRAVLLVPSDACVAANTGGGTCGSCLAPGPKAQIAQLWARIHGASVTVNVSSPIDGAQVAYAADAARAARAAFGENFVAVMFSEDFDCFAAYGEFAASAEAMGASALLIAMRASPYLAPHMYGVADVAGDGARRATPTFSITHTCATRALNGGTNVFVDLPAIGSDGNAVIGPHAYAAGYNVPNTEEMGDTSFKLEHAPTTVCGGGAECLAGQANFNPETYPAVQAELIFLDAVSDCQSWWTCLVCDRLEADGASGATYLRYVAWNGEPLRKVDVAGRVVFAMEDSLRCAHPFTNFVFDFQDHQALGVIIGLSSNTIETLAATSVPFTVTIPTFTIGNDDARQFEQVLKSGEEISVLLPRLANGEAVSGSIGQAIAEGTLRLGKNHGGNYPGGEGEGDDKKNQIGAGEIIGFFVLLGALLAVGAGVVAWRRSSQSGTRVLPAWLTDALRGMRSFGGSPNAPSAARGTAAGAGAASRVTPTRTNPYAEFEEEIDGGHAGNERYALYSFPQPSEVPSPARRGSDPIPPASGGTEMVDAFAAPTLPPAAPPTSLPALAPVVAAGEVELVGRTQGVTNPFETIPPADPYVRQG